ncbi:MAG: hypothetical protein GXO69_07490 [Acidobacteria bacterium]|nr:hypothetical protein [Acidobacteriota bacterium]
MSSCPFCGKNFDGDPAVCPHCGQVIHPNTAEGAGGQMAPPPPPAGSSHDVPQVSGPGEKNSRITVPFEDPNAGFFNGMFETIKLSLFQPSSFFNTYRFEGSIGRPMVFALIVGWFSMAVGVLWSLIFNASIMSVISRYVPNAEQASMNRFGSQFMFSSIGSMVSLVLAPIIIILALFIMAGLYHLFLMMVNGAKRGFETTFNVVCYSTSAKLFMIIPFCGGTVAWIYSLVISIIGISGAHETDGWKGAFAVLMPFVLCCCLTLLFIMFFGAAIAGLAAQH